MKKKLLFVGDLRSAMNYGAVATTESFLELIEQYSDEYEIKLIERKSFSGKTPRGGFKAENDRKTIFLKPLIKIVRRSFLYGIIRRHTRQTKADSNSYVPSRLDDYKKFTDRVLRGDVWSFEKDNIEWADIIVINGEGNIVNGTDKYGLYREGGRYLLYFAYLTRIVYEKPCYFVNHTVDPQNRDIIKIISHVYPKLDGVFVRENLSLKMLRAYGVENAVYVPDALWSHDFDKDKNVCVPNGLNDFDFTKPYVCLGDSSGIENRYNHVKWDVVSTYTNLINEFKKHNMEILFIDGYGGKNPDINSVIKKNNIRSVNFFNCDYHQLYYVLKHAKLFASGRWHASIISLLAGTPVVLWGSDSHKTEALYSEIDYTYEFFDVAALPLNVDRIVYTAMRIISDNHDEVWTKVREKKDLAVNNVKMLQ